MTMQRGKNSKKDTVEKLAELIAKYKVVAIADLHKVTTPLLQLTRKKLRGEAVFRTTKNTLARRAIELSVGRKKKIEALSDYLRGSNLLIFTNSDPFKISALMKKNKIKVLAKAGDVAPYDIVIPAGNTGLPAGPLVSELSDVGIPTRIEVGSIVVKSDTVIAKKGEVISPKVAAVLFRLGIKPIEVGMSLKVAYDDGLLLTQEHLQIDANVVGPQVQEAAVDAFKLAMKTYWPTSQTIPMLLAEASAKSLLLAFQTAFPTSQIVRNLIERAYSENLLLSSKVEGKAID